MKARMVITGVGPLRKQLANFKRKATSISYDVGYTANYALPVHEMVEANFKAPNTQAKFLEEPARTMGPELSKDIGKGWDRGETLDQSTAKAALKLQGVSQKICPVDTDNLRGTAYTRKTK